MWRKSSFSVGGTVATIVGELWSHLQNPAVKATFGSAVLLLGVFAEALTSEHGRLDITWLLQ